MRSLRVAAAAAALVVVLAACGGGSGGGSSSPPASPGKKIDVTLKDFSITVAGGSTVQPGTYTFVVTNQGPSDHNLTVNGPGVSNQATPTFGKGTKDLTVTLKSGTYDLFCSVPGHKAAGMDTKLTVG
jgi:plastocyanin